MAGRGELVPSGFGEALKRLRAGKGWTQKQLADATELHSNTVARLERGEHEPTWPLVLKFAAALGVTCEAFSGCEDVNPERQTDEATSHSIHTQDPPAKGKRPVKPAPKKPAAKRKGKK